jgi:hypothetical protein
MACFKQGLVIAKSRVVRQEVTILVAIRQVFSAIEVLEILIGLQMAPSLGLALAVLILPIECSKSWY